MKIAKLENEELQMRQVVLDTETTGLDWNQGHRIIEIGCVEILDRRISKSYFHTYVNPTRAIEVGAQQVHGISTEFLEDKPIFSTIANDLISYIKGAELIIHNAPFDVGFLNAEFEILEKGNKPIEATCNIFDTLVLAREKHPGQRNSLDALCKRYSIDNRNRVLHGALLDANLLAEVYLAMTGGQTTMELQGSEAVGRGRTKERFDFSTSKFVEAVVSKEDARYNERFLTKISAKEARLG